MRGKDYGPFLCNEEKLKSSEINNIILSLSIPLIQNRLNGHGQSPLNRKKSTKSQHRM